MTILISVIYSSCRKDDIKVDKEKELAAIITQIKSDYQSNTATLYHKADIFKALEWSYLQHEEIDGRYFFKVPFNTGSEETNATLYAIWENNKSYIFLRPTVTQIKYEQLLARLSPNCASLKSSNGQYRVKSDFYLSKYMLFSESTTSLTRTISNRNSCEKRCHGGSSSIWLPEVVVTGTPSPTPITEPSWWPSALPTLGGGGSSTVAQALKNALDKDPTLLLDCSTIAAYIKLGSFKITNSKVIERLDNLNQKELDFSVQDISAGKGAVVNMDFFGINVNSFPILNGQRLSAEQFLDHFRRHINDFTEGVEFPPYKNGATDVTIFGISQIL